MLIIFYFNEKYKTHLIRKNSKIMEQMKKNSVKSDVNIKKNRKLNNKNVIMKKC